MIGIPTLPQPADLPGVLTQGLMPFAFDGTGQRQSGRIFDQARPNGIPFGRLPRQQ